MAKDVFRNTARSFSSSSTLAVDPATSTSRGRSSPSSANASEPPPNINSDTESEPDGDVAHAHYRSSGSKGGDHINRSGNYRGVAFVDKWRAYRRKHPMVPPTAGGKLMLDEYKTVFYDDYMKWDDDVDKLLTVCARGVALCTFRPQLTYSFL